jgi:hypothetical protein
VRSNFASSARKPGREQQHQERRHDDADDRHEREEGGERPGGAVDQVARFVVGVAHLVLGHHRDEGL